MKCSGLLAVSGALTGLSTDVFAAPKQKSKQPNILWITSEDNSPLLGCYGDAQAHTPNLDRLAVQGTRYRNAFANAPVCSAARSTLITGMHASSIGIHNHRSRVRIPESFVPYPVYMRQAGYYCTNNSKQDYNYILNKIGQHVWDVSSGKAHYKNRNSSQPFFAIFNIGTSHEGQLGYSTVERRRQKGDLPPKARISPEDVKFPPYHADTPVVRRDWSVYYDNMTLMDKQVGQLLDELDKSGLADDTIAFYYADHGGALPRGKRNIHDSGTRVPMIVRFGKNFSHLAPTRAGGWIEDPVSFVDLPATVFSLMGIDIPKNFEGKAFLGPQAVTQDHVYLFRGRMDERYDTVRAVRDERWRYVRNYSPHRPWGQMYTYPFRVMPSMKSWYQAYKAGKCNAVQSRYWEAKPGEELYDTKADPYEVRNLIDDQEQAARVRRLRKVLDAGVIRTRDTGFIPEGMFDTLAADKTLYEYAQSDAYPIEKILKIANVASSRNPSFIDKLLAACNDEHPVIRYWGATGCLILGKDASPAKTKLRQLLKDEWPDIRIVAAEAMSYLGETELAMQTLEPLVKSDQEFLSLTALNALDYMEQAGHISNERICKLIEGVNFKTTPERMAKYFRDGV